MIRRILTAACRILVLLFLAAFLFLSPRSLYFLALCVIAALAAGRLLNRPLKPVTVGLLAAIVVVEHVLRYFYFPAGLGKTLLCLVAASVCLLPALRGATGRQTAFCGAASLAVFSLLGIWGYDLAPPVIKRDTNPAGPVVFLGDSLTAGIDEPPSKDLYVSLLQGSFQTSMINAGQAGDLTIDALGRLQKDVLRYKPRLVVVMIGGNDILSPMPRAFLKTNLEQIVERVAATDTDLVLVEVPGGVIVDRYFGVYSETARKYGVRLVGQGMLRRILCLAPIYTSDGIHLSRKGNEFVAARFGSVLRDGYGIR